MQFCTNRKCTSPHTVFYCSFLPALSLSLSPLPLAKAESDLDLARMLQIMLGIAIHCEKKQGKAFLSVCVCVHAYMRLWSTVYTSPCCIFQCMSRL